MPLLQLAQLPEQRYGYTLRKALADDGLEIDEGTLYPLLRRLESLLVSQWREEDKRNKRFYRLSLQGRQMLSQLLNEWERINDRSQKFFKTHSIMSKPANSNDLLDRYRLGMFTERVISHRWRTLRRRSRDPTSAGSACSHWLVDGSPNRKCSIPIPMPAFSLVSETRTGCADQRPSRVRPGGAR